MKNRTLAESPQITASSQTGCGSLSGDDEQLIAEWCVETAQWHGAVAAPLNDVPVPG